MYVQHLTFFTLFFTISVRNILTQTLCKNLKNTDFKVMNFYGILFIMPINMLVHLKMVVC